MSTSSAPSAPDDQLVHLAEPPDEQVLEEIGYIQFADGERKNGLGRRTSRRP